MLSDKLIDINEKTPAPPAKHSDFRYTLICTQQLKKALYDKYTGITAFYPEFTKKNWTDLVDIEIALNTLEQLLEAEPH